MDTTQYWDELADVYMVTDSTTDWLLGYPTVVQFLGDIGSKSVLDIGCGSGRFTRFYAKLNPLARIIGVDASPKAIENARQKTEDRLGVEYHILRSIEDLRNFEFKMAYANFLFCTMPNKDTVIQYMSTIREQLPDGGALVILEPHPDTHGKLFTSLQSDRATGLKSGDPIHVRLFTNSIDVEFDNYYWTKTDYEEMIRAAGLRIVEIKEPIAEDSTDENIGAEREFPPFLIIKAVK